MKEEWSTGTQRCVETDETIAAERSGVDLVEYRPLSSTCAVVVVAVANAALLVRIIVISPNIQPEGVIEIIVFDKG